MTRNATPTPERDPSAASLTAAIRHAVGPHTATRPYLGQYAVVEEVVRGQFLGGLLARAVAQGEGRLSAQQVGTQNVAACCRMARIFGGNSPNEYTSVGAWNEGDGPGTLAALVRERIAHVVAPQHLVQKESALQCLFSVVATDMFAAIERLNADGDAPALQERTEELTEDLTRLLLGLPADF